MYYAVPFGPDTEGRLKMLRLFSLHRKSSDEIFWHLVGVKQVRISLMHFTREQLQLQTRGAHAGKSFSKLLPPACFDERLLVRRPDAQLTLNQSVVPAGSPANNTRTFKSIDPDSIADLPIEQQLIHYKRLVSQLTAEKSEYKRQLQEARRSDEENCARLERCLRLAETETQALLRELDEYRSTNPSAKLSVESLKTDRFLRQNVRRLTSFRSPDAFMGWLALTNVKNVMANISPHAAYKDMLRLGSSDGAMQMVEPVVVETSTSQIMKWQDGVLCVLVHLRSGADTADLFPYFG